MVWHLPNYFYTILGGIAEFGSVFLFVFIFVYANVWTIPWRCPTDTDALAIFSLPKWTSSESRYEPPRPNSLRVYQNATMLCCSQTCGPAAARFLRTSIKADTKSLGRSLCLVEQPPSELSKLWRTEIIEKRQKENTPNSWFRITSIKRIGWTPHETKETLQCTPNRFTDGSVRYRK